MPGSIRWTDQALRDLGALDPPVARRTARKLDQAAEDPLRFFSRLVSADESKPRIGVYRLLAALLHETKTILVEGVGHRSRIYGRRG